MSSVSTLREENSRMANFFRWSMILINFAVHQIDDIAKNKYILVGEDSQENVKTDVLLFSWFSVIDTNRPPSCPNFQLFAIFCPSKDGIHTQITT